MFVQKIHQHHNNREKNRENHFFDVASLTDGEKLSVDFSEFCRTDLSQTSERLSALVTDSKNIIKHDQPDKIPLSIETSAYIFINISII
jgi:hypothetical protein